ncbi:hypothetical protein CEXT_784761 [Caerostris extrusa]|uniref:Uncharacterized protein n=1 Tax=Caerostris extrusa TaxID=172846 RepID=A0AAV4UKZ5_CAEEX|nr:hypothetical protein CEXT_784761 [Caerostris extrusa]
MEAKQLTFMLEEEGRKKKTVQKTELGECLKFRESSNYKELKKDGILSRKLKKGNWLPQSHVAFHDSFPFLFLGFSTYFCLMLRRIVLWLALDIVKAFSRLCFSSCLLAVLPAHTLIKLYPDSAIFFGLQTTEKLCLQSISQGENTFAFGLLPITIQFTEENSKHLILTMF